MAFHLFPVKPVTKWHNYQQIENLGQRTYTAKNPSYGATINVFVNAKPTEKVVATISDQNGQVVRTISDTTLVAGLNKMNWDLRGDEPTKLTLGGGGGWRGNFRPLVSPGMYKVSVKVDGVEHTSGIEVKADPRLEVSEDDYEQIAKQTSQLTDVLSQATEMINDIDNLKDQLTNLKKRLKSEDGEKYKEEIKMIVDAYKELDNQRNELMRPTGSMNYRSRPRLREEILSMLFAVNGTPAKPTAPQMERAISLSEEAAEKNKLLQETKDGPIRRISEALEAIPILDLRVKLIKP